MRRLLVSVMSSASGGGDGGDENICDDVQPETSRILYASSAVPSLLHGHCEGCPWQPRGMTPVTRRYAYMCIIVGIPRYFTRSQRCSPPVRVSTSLLYCTKCPVIGPPGSLKENQPNQSDFILGHPNFMHRILAHVHRPKSEKDVPQTAHAGTRLTRQRARYQARPFSGRGVSFAGKALFVLNFHHAAAPSREIFFLCALVQFRQPTRSAFSTLCSPSVWLGGGTGWREKTPGHRGTSLPSCHLAACARKPPRKLR